MGKFRWPKKSRGIRLYGKGAICRPYVVGLPDDSPITLTELCGVLMHIPYASLHEYAWHMSMYSWCTMRITYPSATSYSERIYHCACKAHAHRHRVLLQLRVVIDESKTNPVLRYLPQGY